MSLALHGPYARADACGTSMRGPGRRDTCLGSLQRAPAVASVGDPMTWKILSNWSISSLPFARKVGWQSAGAGAARVCTLPQRGEGVRKETCAADGAGSSISARERQADEYVQDWYRDCCCPHAAPSHRPAARPTPPPPPPKRRGPHYHHTHPNACMRALFLGGCVCKAPTVTLVRTAGHGQPARGYRMRTDVHMPHHTPHHTAP